MISLSSLFALSIGIAIGNAAGKAVHPDSGDAAPSDFRQAAPACTAEVKEHADEGALHVNTCSQLQFATNPPSSGTHYGTWAAYKTYAQPVPAGFLVHDLEHGAVVIGYNCREGCADEVAQVQTWMNALGNDPICPGSSHKIILAPNPDLDVRWGAAAWAWTWKASCPDTASLGAFFRAHYGKTVEAGACGGGSDLSTPGWCTTPVRRPPAEGRLGNLGGTQGRRRILWAGSLPARGRLVVEAAAADGAILETYDLGHAGPGAAEATWDVRAFRERHPSAGPVLLRVRTSGGRELARGMDLPASP